MRSRYNFVANVLAVFLLQRILAPDIASAADDAASLIITFDQSGFEKEFSEINSYVEKGLVPAPLVYIQGELAGSVPGQFVLPKTDQVIAVEIGTPQFMKGPLYSFALGSSETERSEFDVVTSNFAFKHGASENVWSDVFLEPNIRQPVTAHKEGETQTIALPPRAYLSLAQFWRDSKIQPYGPNWISDIPKANDFSLEEKIDHIVFDAATQEVIELSSADAWSGVKLAMFELPIEEQTWIIQSIPEKASVHTADGEIGTTNIRKSLRITGGFFVVVKLAGFPDCTDQTGEKSQVGKVVTLTCRFE